MEQAIVLLKTAGLFVVTALAEIVGCFLPYLWLRKGGPIWLLVPAAASLDNKGAISELSVSASRC
jgi:small multidrug resistance family-3 protein